jgi:hypothetical protein
MPMGDCDRMKKHVSDYVDKNLDPTTRKEFEKNLKLSADLRYITKNISVISGLLQMLPSYKCSDDFILNLRQRIHSESGQKVSKTNMMRYSFAFSFVVLAVVAVFVVNNLIDKPAEPAQFQPALENQKIDAGPSNLPAGTSNNSYIEADEVDIKLRDAQHVVTDSAGMRNEERNKPGTKYVKQSNKVPNRE